jgi:hypothetical protein
MRAVLALSSANGRPHALRIAGEKCAVPFSSRESKANDWLSSTVQAARTGQWKRALQPKQRPSSFGCAMLPCWMCVALQARHSSEDFQTISVARRDLVSHRVLDDDGCFTPLPGECEHARPVLDDMTLGDGHPSFRAEGDGSARYKQA